MAYRLIEEAIHSDEFWYMEFAEDVMIMPDWFKESDEHGILSACSPWRPCDNPIQ